MLKKFCKECSFLAACLFLLNLAGIVIIFLGAFTNIPNIARCFLLIMGIACLVGSTAAWVISIYEFEKVEILLNLKEEMIEKKGIE